MGRFSEMHAELAQAAPYLPACACGAEALTARTTGERTPPAPVSDREHADAAALHGTRWSITPHGRAMLRGEG